MGEKIALGYLLEHGYHFLEQHYQCRYGEIDLILKDHEEIVFVEVKYRKNIDDSYPEDMVDRKKIKNLMKTANHFLQQRKAEEYFRYDIVAISGDKMPYEIEHFKDTIRVDHTL